MDDDDYDEESVIIEEDYYTLLNVSRTATPEEISNAYRRLSRLYHPDKHTDVSKKHDAEILFNKTKKAHEILSDEHKRAIYDSLGVKGLETEGWEIVQRSKTPQEIREEYERLARRRDERRLQQRTNPKGVFTVSVNATELFSQYEDDYIDAYSPMVVWPIEVKDLSISQSIEAPLTLRDTLTLHGNISTLNHSGSGSFTVGAKRLLSDTSWIELDLSCGNGPAITFKAFRSLTKSIFGTFVPHLQFTNQGISAGAETSLAMKVSDHTMGYVVWRAGGSNSSMSTSVARDTDRSHFGLTLQLGIPHSFASLNYTHKLKEREMKLKTSAKAGTFGALFEYGVEKKVSEQSTISAMVSVGVPTGVSLKLKLVRASQTYFFPIHVCEEIVPSHVFYATVTPLFVYVMVKRLVVDPMMAEQHKRDKERQRQVNKKRMAERRREAEAAVKLMAETFSRIRSDEEQKRGLVVVKAIYGRIVIGQEAGPGGEGAGPSGEGGAGPSRVGGAEHSEEIIDVRIPLQCLVKNSKLVLHDTSKSQLPGFFDPCVGEDKSLFVQYLFHNHLHEVTVSDKDPLMIPKHSHRIPAT
ncbi:dnaJ homolog subfamily C member 11 isoform X2 [Nilaparvata lugens]|uniref:dnaJ homolog subfamily C member 11 isoform X2 n=1 Tax=Nilaparvata lugens TaxID=108931 RepID=UPI00193E8045|nr:dnaJ homolog subfamily C member 11 isoform X2 [Nilaparvata lugens]